MNGNRVTAQGDWVYYLQPFYSNARQRESNNIYKIRLDGTGREKIGDHAWEINVVGDWLYYITSGNDGYRHLHKMRTDGTEAQMVERWSVGIQNNDGGMTVADNIIFFLSEGQFSSARSYSGNLYMTGTSGGWRSTSLACFTELYGTALIADGWIYFLYQLNLYKQPVGGTLRDMIRLTDGIGYNFRNEEHFIIDGDWIYFQRTYAGNKNYMYRIRTDGTREARLFEYSGGPFNVSDGWIYYYTFEDNAFFRVRGDGTRHTKLMDNNTNYATVVGLYIIDDWIYYYGQNGLQRFRTDGSSRIQAVSV
jgi:hypothetical protein